MFLRAVLTFAVSLSAFAAPLPIFDSAPEHPWNRLYYALCLHGLQGNENPVEELDPLLFGWSNYLFADETHDQAIELLDAFIQQRADSLITDPLRRAILQRDLWAVHDWLDDAAPLAQTKTGTATAGDPNSSTAERKRVQRRLIVIMRRIALTPNEIAALPNELSRAATSPAPAEISNGNIIPLNPVTAKSIQMLVAAGRDIATIFANDNPVPAKFPWTVMRPALPAGLNDSSNGWILVGDGVRRQPVAERHTGIWKGRSVFAAFFRLPGGEIETRRFLDDINHQPATSGSAAESAEIQNGVPNSLPGGSDMALVRRAFLLDDDGIKVLSPLIEEVRLIGIRFIPLSEYVAEAPAIDVRTMRLAKFVMDRSALFANKPGLRAIAPEDEKTITSFDIMRMHDESDVFARSATAEKLGILKQCAGCHGGFESVLNRIRVVNADTGPFSVRGKAVESSFEQQAERTRQASSSVNPWISLTNDWKRPDDELLTGTE